MNAISIVYVLIDVINDSCIPVLSDLGVHRCKHNVDKVFVTQLVDVNHILVHE
jgi:hypothetical protein